MSTHVAVIQKSREMIRLCVTFDVHMTSNACNETLWHDVLDVKHIYTKTHTLESVTVCWERNINVECSTNHILQFYSGSSDIFFGNSN